MRGRSADAQLLGHLRGTDGVRRVAHGIEDLARCWRGLPACTARRARSAKQVVEAVDGGLIGFSAGVDSFALLAVALELLTELSEAEGLDEISQGAYSKCGSHRLDIARGSDEYAVDCPFAGHVQGPQ